MRKVKITKLPKKAEGGSHNFQQMPMNKTFPSNEARTSVGSTLSPVPRNQANLEAEKGENVITDLHGDGIPENYRVGGSTHANGGTPLNLPESFIFSKKLKTNDPMILEEFGKPVPKKGRPKKYSFADLAKTYDLNTYKKILHDKNSTPLQIETAEKMIANYNMKLGKLALVQESTKGFETGIPDIAMPYLETMGIDPEAIAPAQMGMDEIPMAEFGGAVNNLRRFIPEMADGGESRAKRKATKQEDKFLKKWSKTGEIPTDPSDPRLSLAESELLTKWITEGKPIPTTPTNTNEKKVLSEWSENTSEIVAASDVARNTKRSLNDFVGGNQRVVDFNQPEEGVVDFRLRGEVPGGGVYTPDGEGTQTDPEVKVSYKTTKKYNIPDDAYTVDDSDENWREQALQAQRDGKNVYVKSGEGYKHVTGLKMPEAEYDKDSDKFKRMGQYAGEYAAMEKMINENPEFQDAVYDEYKKVHAKNKGKMGKELSKEDVLKNFMNAQSQVYAIREGISKQEQLDPSWDKSTTDKYAEVAKKLGFDVMDKDAIGTFQGTYEAMSNLSEDPKFKKIFDNYDVTPVGLGDEATGKQRDISPIDAVFGNTTQGQWFRPKATELGLEDIDPEIIKEKQKELIPGSPEYKQPETDAEWWLQDKVKTFGAARDMHSIKKYLPWDRPLDPTIPDPTFYDPSRALAAGAEQAAIAAGTVGAFAGAQGTSSRISDISGKALANAANTLGDYENKNVAIANQHSNMAAQIRNAADDANRQISKGLYDGTTIANQQFDNSKAKAREQLRSSFIDAITNRAQAQAMNQMYPQYNVDPSSGGFVDFTEGRPQTVGSTGNTNSAVNKNTIEEIQRLKNQGYDESTIRLAMGKNPQPFSNNPERDAFMRSYMNRQT